MAHILIIDDDDLFRSMLRDTLQVLGHSVTEAANGREGLERLQERPPDLVMTDIIMPDMEGIETIIGLRRSHPRLPVIAMSGGGRGSANDYLQVAQQLGATRVLAKPFSTEELQAAIAAVPAPD